MAEGRRSAFSKDLKEFVLKLGLGMLFGFGIQLWSGWTGEWWVPYALGVFAALALGYVIRGESRSHAD